VLDHGRTTYRPPAALADHVRARDVHCRNPICRRRVVDGTTSHHHPRPPPATGTRELPKALAAELDRRERNRMTTDWWNGTPAPPDEHEDVPPPF
jgi:hypothetical protein